MEDGCIVVATSPIMRINFPQHMSFTFFNCSKTRIGLFIKFRLITREQDFSLSEFLQNFSKILLFQSIVVSNSSFCFQSETLVPQAVLPLFSIIYSVFSISISRICLCADKTHTQKHSRYDVYRFCIPCAVCSIF